MLIGDKMFQFRANEYTAIIWLALAHGVCDIYGGFINPLMPFISEKLGFSLAIATTIIAITQVCSNMLQPIFGFFADNILKRFFIFWGLIFASIFIPFAPALANAKLFMLFMIIGCVGGSLFHPQAMGFINTFSKDNYSKNMGKFVFAGSFGFALGPLIASTITQNAGLENIVYTSILGFITASAMFFMVPKLSKTYKITKTKNFIEAFKEIITNSQINIVMLIAMMKSLIVNCCCILLPFLWKSLGYKPIYIGIALFLFVFAGSLGSLTSAFFEKKYGTNNILRFSLIATFPILVLFSQIYNSMPITSMIAFALIGFITNLSQPLTIILAQKILPQYKSIVSGFANGFCWGITAIILSALGLIAEKIGIINVLLIISIIPIFASYTIKYLKKY